MWKIPFTKYHILKEQNYSIPFTLTILDEKRRVVRLCYQAMMEWRNRSPRVIAVVSLKDIVERSIPELKNEDTIQEEEEEIQREVASSIKSKPNRGVKPKPKLNPKSKIKKKYKLVKEAEPLPDLGGIPYQLDATAAQYFQRELHEASSSDIAPIVKRNR